MTGQEKSGIKVLVVEDEETVRQEYQEVIKKHDKLFLAAETGVQEEALLILETGQIDAVILDLEISGGSGILLLSKIRQRGIKKPFIAVVTNVVSKVIYETVRNLGADYICYKGDKNYSPDIPFSIIEISAPFQKAGTTPVIISDGQNSRIRLEILRKNIETQMDLLGFSEKASGTVLIKEALFYILSQEIRHISVTTDIYPMLGRRFHSNDKNVEKNIRSVIERVWIDQPVDRLKEGYPFAWNQKTGRPTNAEFLYNMSKMIR